jgi:hypothetical protein
MTSFNVFAWYTSSVLITSAYRYLGKYQVNGTITCLSMFLQTVFACITTSSFPKFEVDKNTFLVAGSQGSYILAANICLQYVPIHIAVTFKCLVPSLSVLFAKLYNIEVPDSKVFFNLVYIFMGLILTNYNPNETFIFDDRTIIGFCIAGTAAIMSSLRYSVVSISLVENDPKEIVRDTCIVMGLMMSPLAIIQASNFTELDTALITLFPGLLIISLLGYLLSISEYRVIHANGVYHTTLFEVLKETGLIVGSFFIESEPNFIRIMGILIILTSIINAKINTT